MLTLSVTEEVETRKVRADCEKMMDTDSDDQTDTAVLKIKKFENII